MRLSSDAIHFLIAAKVTKRFPRAADYWTCPIVEQMESRLLLSSGSVGSEPVSASVANATLNTGIGTPNTTYSTPTSAPISPVLMRDAYGLGNYNASNVVFNGVQGTGAGQTIALVEGTSDPDLVANMTAFDTYWGLPAPPSLTQYNSTGGTSLPSVFDPDVLEMDLDVEWLHVMAPLANLVVFEGLNLYGDISTAASWPGVSVISISYTISGTEPISEFETPVGHNGVTFVASEGDTAKEVSDPAMSPAVVSVGGTHLVMSGTNYGSESGWTSGGGGVNTAEAQPAYQNGIVSAFSTADRVTPDVALDADSATGVAVYDQYDNGTTKPWTVVGGTSLSAPLMAGMVAVADQGRALAGLPTLDGYTQTLPRLYSLYTDAYSTNYHDITTGGNGYNAGVGYDMSTGLGSPVGNHLIPDLAGADTISGQVFLDNNGNGIYDGSDTPMAGVTVYLDINNTGSQNSGDPTAVTDSNGFYTFSDQVGSESGVVRLVSSSIPTGDLHSVSSGAFTTSYDQTQTVNLGFYASNYAATAAMPVASGNNISISLSLTGAGPADASSFLYTWAATTKPSGATTGFSVNGTNAASSTSVTCSTPGTYIFTVTISDGQGSSVTSSVTVNTSQTLTTIVVTPGAAEMNENQTRTFTAVAYDQFGIPMANQPVFAWTLSSGTGSVNASGVYSAPDWAGSATITASSGVVTGSATITMINANPTITASATATPSPVTGTTASLSVAGNDDGGAGNLLYTWSATTIPVGATLPAFSINSTNAAQNTVATFFCAGAYVFTVTVSDGQGGSTTSSVSVTVSQTGTTIIVAPGTASLNENQSVTFTAVAYDQFGNVLASQPTFTWARTTGIGSINSSGVYTSPSGSGTATITAAASSAVGSATINVSNASPTITTPPSASPSSVVGTTTLLSVTGNDDGGAGNLLYTWVATTVPNGAATPMFSVNGTNTAQNTTVTFTRAGAYTFNVTIDDGQGGTVTSSVSVTVNQTLSSITVLPGSASLNENQTQLFTAVGYDQFGNSLLTQPSFDWAKRSGIGSINSGGLYTSPGAAGTATITATASSIVGDATITVTDSPPAVTTPASASASPVTGSTVALSVAGSSDAGPSNIDYTWSATSVPNGAELPTFSANGTSAAQNTTATFSSSGSYTFMVTLNDGQGGTTTSSVSVNVMQTLTSIVVSPETTALNENQIRAFSAVAYDQFGNSLASQPTFVWAKSSGIGSISSSGVYLSPDTAGTAIITASASSISGSASISISDANPTVTTAAAATPSPVTGTSTALSVVGNDDGGAGNLVYTWAATAIPNGAGSPTFSVNQTGSAQNTTATFSSAGSYTFTVTLTDGQGGIATSSVSVNVSQALTSVVVTPGNAALNENQTRSFAAVAYDQFGDSLANQPVFTWAKSAGIGSINSGGIYSSPASSGTATVTATAESIVGTAYVNVINANPTITAPAAATPSPATGTTTALNVAANDDGGAANLLFTWVATTVPGGATAPRFSVNGTNAAQNTTATFTSAGFYTFAVTINDGQGGTIASSVNVTVDQTLSSIVVTPGTASLNEDQTRSFSAAGYDQFNNVLTSQPAFTWSKASGIGSISSAGVYTSPGSSGLATIQAAALSILGSADVTITNGNPTVTAPAAATPSPVTGTTAALSVAGTDDGGAAGLIYTWSTTSVPSGVTAPTFSVNGTNAAQNATAIFEGAGTYTFTVTISDGQGGSTTSSVNVTVNQTLWSVVVTPGTASLNENQTKAFAAMGYDQFGIAMLSQPSFTWSKTSGTGSVNGSGLYTSATAAGTATISATASSVSGSASITVTDARPTVITPAAATPSPVAGTTTSLSVVGNDDGGAANLTYTWEATILPNGASAPLFSTNGNNTAQNTTATFSRAGTYTFSVTLNDGQGGTVISSVSVTVNQTITSITVMPGTAALNENRSQAFNAIAYDQFGIALASQPTFAWAKTSGVGSVNSSGVYTSPATSGSATITATASSVAGSASVTIVDAPPTITTPAAATPSPITGTTTALSVTGDSDAGASSLSYTWVATTVPSGAAVPTFSINGTNAAQNTTATFNRAGTYSFTVTLNDGQGEMVSSSVSVTVSQTLTSITVSPAATTLHENQTQTFSAVAYDQFGNATLSQPALTWAKSSGIGSITSGGVYTSPGVAGSAVITATAASVVGSAGITVVNASPTVTASASASPSTVTATTTTLSVTGNDDGGAANLLYTWTATTIPSGAASPSFSINGNNTARITSVTFTSAGLYTFNVTLNDGQGGTTTSSVAVTVDQTLTSVAVTPATVNMNEDQTQRFTAVGFDQFGSQLTSQPSFSWSITSGIGSIDSDGLYSSPASAGTAMISATNHGIAGLASITVTNASPTIVRPAAAAPSQVTGTTTALSVSGGDDGGAAGLTYTWAVTAVPSGATDPTFSVNGTNSAQNTTASFDCAGDYAFTVTIDDGQGATVTSSVNVTVEQTLTHIIVSPGTAAMNENQTQAFIAVAYDQFQNALIAQPVFTWSITSGIGSIGSASGVFTSPDAIGIATVTASAAAIYGSASIVVNNSGPTVTTAASASPSVITSTTTALSVLGNSDVGESNLSYTWTATAVPSGASAPTFSINGTNAAKNTAATFSAAGVYTFTVTLNDGQGGTATSSVSVTVNQALAAITTAAQPVKVFRNSSSQLAAEGWDQFGNVMENQPAFTWYISEGGAGSISSSGLYTAPGTVGATAELTVAYGAFSTTAAVAVVPDVINGTNGDDTIRLVRDGANLLVYVNDPSTPAYNVSYASLSSLTVAEGNGTDSINVDFSGGGSPVPAGGLTIDGGAGSDLLTITGTSGDDTASVNASAVTFNASIISYDNIDSIVVNGNGGADTLTQAAQPGNGAALIFNGTTSGGPSSSDTLNVSGGSFAFNTPTPGAGVQPISLASLNVVTGASVSLGTAAAHTDRWVLTLGSLTLDGGQLDLGGNDMLLHNGSESAMFQLLKSGSAQGNWNGDGINSSAAASDTTHLTALGMITNDLEPGVALYTTFDNQAVMATDVLVKYTYLGDANLDGVVDSTDYSRIDNGFISHLTGWFNGDFLYSGVVDGSSYTMMDNADTSQRTSLGGSPKALPAATVVDGLSSSKANTKPTAAWQACIFANTSISTKTAESSCALFWKWYDSATAFAAR
jgi:hypothetical protein